MATPTPKFQVYSVQKTSAGTLNHEWDTPFSETPTVLVTAYWKNYPYSYTQSAETIVYVDKYRIEVYSNRADAQNYHVNILAIEQGTTKLCNLKIAAGTTVDPKEETRYDIDFESDLSFHKPPVLLSPLWSKHYGDNNYIETVDYTSRSAATILSAHNGTDFYVNYMGIDRGISGDKTGKVEVGTFQKRVTGICRVYFESQMTHHLPTIFISPWFDEQNAAIGYIPVITKVERDYFEFYSYDNATNLNFNWVAITPA